MEAKISIILDADENAFVNVNHASIIDIAALLLATAVEDENVAKALQLASIALTMRKINMR